MFKKEKLERRKGASVDKMGKGRIKSLKQGEDEGRWRN